MFIKFQSKNKIKAEEGKLLAESIGKLINLNHLTFLISKKYNK